MDKKWISGAVALVVMLVAVAWWLGWFGKAEDPLIAQTQQLVATPQAEQTTQQRTDLRDAWRERFQGLNEEQRMALFEQMAPIFMPLMMRQFESRYEEFMAMSPEQQRAELDKRINEMQKRAAPGQGGGQFGGNRPQMEPAKAAEFQKKMLAWTTPEQRAKFQNGMMMFANRMKERGLTPPPMPGGGFF